MLYCKNDNLKNKIINEIKNRGEEVTPETIMQIANEFGISFGYLRHDEDDSVYLILNNDLIYLDTFAEIVKTEGSYKKYEDPMSGVTELENKMMKDIETIREGNLDMVLLGKVI